MTSTLRVGGSRLLSEAGAAPTPNDLAPNPNQSHSTRRYPGPITACNLGLFPEVPAALVSIQNPGGVVYESSSNATSQRRSVAALVREQLQECPWARGPAHRSSMPVRLWTMREINDRPPNGIAPVKFLRQIFQLRMSFHIQKLPFDLRDNNKISLPQPSLKTYYNHHISKPCALSESIHSIIFLSVWF
jgi:hypothetical protein